MADSTAVVESSGLEEASRWWGDSPVERLAFFLGVGVGTVGLLRLMEPLGWWLSVAGWALVFLVRWLHAVAPEEPSGSSKSQTTIEVLQRLTIGILLGGGLGLLVVGGQRLLDADGAAAVAALAGCIAVFTTALVLAKGDQRLLGLVFFAVGIAVFLTGSRVLALIFLAFGVFASGLPQRIRSWVDEQSGR